MRRVAALAVSAAALCAAASASGPGRLDLMPLPRSALGPGAAALALATDSGVVSNAYAARSAGHGFTAADIARRGRITGYTLDYFLPERDRPADAADAARRADDRRALSRPVDGDPGARFLARRDAGS